MKYFIDQLQQKIEEKDSRICVGLDPHLEMMPENVLAAELLEDIETNQKEIADSVLKFNQNLIDAVADMTAVVKPQMAFYEKLGVPGMECLWQTIAYAKTKDLIVLLDGKRNDIGSTAGAYAEAYLENKKIGVDSITINPYLGSDGVLPFLENKEKGAFALLRTSNPSAVDLQDLKLDDGRTVYQAVGDFLQDLGRDYLGECGYSNLAAVVGATYPKELKEIRSQLDSVFFLIPGFGAQGGGAADIKAGFDEDGRGAVVNSSRGINFAYRQEEYSYFGAENYAKAARAAAEKMKKEINDVLK
ncbi:orotidine-5'-phosphate decarboxylase [Halanaerobium congolense]|uniref:Orotidine 5'-phosphate decarboxylase n=1 Tax=Halanaerobium congolense TaxID=54121 RepID=A0A1I0A7D1_9FIRM|nr:orotidine-5'-phosphate decarboxylase [Halanaerobium congolense]PTX17936.1 orotidine-5'-phosphate decarboxylase [Halanaerobium congolense]SDF36191.1 orotidine-5'-phosphate decarboxylase [Halanaerobium congolense]SES90075.1 orotidine-5'-phosphate decarboxylase [Halanaerobium congolense]SFP19335.1 orotidine-5'-phosphate decarboxylase [Halanaerobium congolense]